MTDDVRRALIFALCKAHRGDNGQLPEHRLVEVFGHAAEPVADALLAAIDEVAIRAFKEYLKP